MHRGEQWFGFGGSEGSPIGTADLHHIRHHVDVSLVQVLPDPSMVGSDVNRDLPSAHLDPPPSLPPRDTDFGGPRECDRAAEIGEVEPVRDDPLERRISLADSSAVRPSIVDTSPHAGHRGIAVWPSQHQRDRVARPPQDRVLTDPPNDVEVRYARQLHHPRSVVWGQPPHQPVMQHDRLPGLIEGVHGGKWRDRFAGWRLLRAHGAIVGLSSSR